MPRHELRFSQRPTEAQAKAMFKHASHRHLRRNANDGAADARMWHRYRNVHQRDGICVSFWRWHREV